MLITDKVNRILSPGLDQCSRPGELNGRRGHLGGEGYIHKEGEDGNCKAVNSIHLANFCQEKV